MASPLGLLSGSVDTLTYHAGQFVRDLHADTAAYIQAQNVKEPENATIPVDPATGYVIEPFRGLHPRTRLDWNGYTIVSLGTDGLAWTGSADAAKTVFRESRDLVDVFKKGSSSKDMKPEAWAQAFDELLSQPENFSQAWRTRIIDDNQSTSGPSWPPSVGNFLRDC